MQIRGENMIKTYAMMIEELSEYSAPANKLGRMGKEGIEALGKSRVYGRYSERCLKNK